VWHTPLVVFTFMCQAHDFKRSILSKITFCVYLFVFSWINTILNETHHPLNCHSRTSEGFQWMVSCLSSHGHIQFTLFPSYVDKTISGPKQHKFTLADQSNSQNCPTNLWVSSPNHCGLLFFSRILPKMESSFI